MENYNLAVSALKDFMGLHSTGKRWDQPQNQDHGSLCALGANWLVRNHKCRAVLVEKGCSAAEMPDVIGFYYSESFLIEAKMSRPDFVADSKKGFRANPNMGMGKYRYYICPKDLIGADEVPENWGLLYVSEKGRITKKKEAAAFDEYNKHAEYLMLTSALSTPWKLFQHWGESALERLFQLRWVSKNTEVDLKLFACRLMAQRMDDAETNN